MSPQDLTLWQASQPNGRAVGTSARHPLVELALCADPCGKRCKCGPRNGKAESCPRVRQGRLCGNRSKERRRARLGEGSGSCLVFGDGVGGAVPILRRCGSARSDCCREPRRIDCRERLCGNRSRARTSLCKWCLCPQGCGTWRNRPEHACPLVDIAKCRALSRRIARASIHPACGTRRIRLSSGAHRIGLCAGSGLWQSLQLRRESGFLKSSLKWQAEHATWACFPSRGYLVLEWSKSKPGQKSFPTAGGVAGVASLS